MNIYIIYTQTESPPREPSQPPRNGKHFRFIDERKRRWRQRELHRRSSPFYSHKHALPWANPRHSPWTLPPWSFPPLPILFPFHFHSLLSPLFLGSKIESSSQQYGFLFFNEKGSRMKKEVGNSGDLPNYCIIFRFSYLIVNE